jgi:predicted short-subunit dehydrogenase-like oxidoreductase (DUF2520 family)
VKARAKDRDVKDGKDKPASTAVNVPKGTVALVGAGKLASFLAPALTEAGFKLTEILARDRVGSIKRAQTLAQSVGARAMAMRKASLGAEILWFAVPDGEIRSAAKALTRQVVRSGVRFAFHSSGAQGSRELDALREAGLAVASAHPLMTFVPRTKPSLKDVPFAIEGDRPAVKKARAIVRAIGGRSIVLAARHKAAYHSWATMTSPLLLAYLVTLEEVARKAGLERDAARRMSLPIIRQTLENYARLGPADSFSGPFIRGDVATVAKHLALMEHHSKTRAVYVALARVALDGLPVRNRAELRRLLVD